MKKWWILGGSIIGCLVAAPVVFGVVVVLLNMIGKVFGMSYEMTNIVIYYILIPLIWLVMLVIFAYRAKKVLYWILVGIIGFIDYIFWFSRIDIWNERFFSILFNESYIFLDSLPGDYIIASVYSCVIVPILVLLGILFLILNVHKYHYKTNIWIIIFLLFIFVITYIIGYLMGNAGIHYYLPNKNLC